MCTIITSSRNTEWYVELWMVCERSVVICGLCVAIFRRREQLVLDLFPDAGRLRRVSVTVLCVVCRSSAL